MIIVIIPPIPAKEEELEVVDSAEVNGTTKKIIINPKIK